MRSIASFFYETGEMLLKNIEINVLFHKNRFNCGEILDLYFKKAWRLFRYELKFTGMNFLFFTNMKDKGWILEAYISEQKTISKELNGKNCKHSFLMEIKRVGILHNFKMEEIAWKCVI